MPVRENLSASTAGGKALRPLETFGCARLPIDAGGASNPGQDEQAPDFRRSTRPEGVAGRWPTAGSARLRIARAIDPERRFRPVKCRAGHDMPSPRGLRG
jgi:hypothetical protein